MAKQLFIPFTPAGTEISHLAAPKFRQAKKRLLRDAAHMPYDGWQGFYDRGYRIYKRIEHSSFSVVGSVEYIELDINGNEVTND